MRLASLTLVCVTACQVNANADREGFACNAGWTCENGLTCVANVCIKTPATALTCAALSGRECTTTEVCGHALVNASDIMDCCPDNSCLDITTKLYAEAPHAHAPPPVIDGDTSDWLGATRIPLTKVLGPPPTSPTDFAVRFAVRWDETALYLLLEVTDDIWNPAGNSAPWEDDVGEVFLDMDPRNPQATWQTDEDQFLLLQNNTADEGQTHPRDWTATVAYVHEAPSNDWHIESAIDWPAGFPKPRAGDVVGFDVAADDDDGAVSNNLRIRQLNWNNTGQLAADASYFGLLRLDADTAEAHFPLCGDGACEGTETCPRCPVDCAGGQC